MIIVRRSSSNVNKLQNILSISTSSQMSSPPPLLPVSTGSSCGANAGTSSTSGTGGGQNQSFDWAYFLSSENKAKTIQLLTIDRENSGFGLKEAVANDPQYRKAAVLVPLCLDKNGQPSLLYNLRSQQLNKHKGEISFPGGTMDPEDKNDPVACALRETREELGISSELIEIWTTLRLFPTVSSNLGVIPVLGLVNGTKLDPSALKINLDEVDHAFTVTLEQLCNPDNWEEGPMRNFKGLKFHMPVWKNLNVFNGTEEVYLWGLTAFITHIALLALLPQDVYQRKLPYLHLQLKKVQDNKPKL